MGASALHHRGRELRIGGEHVVEVRRHRTKPNLVACRIVDGGELILDGEQLAEMVRADWASDADTDPYEREPEKVTNVMQAIVGAASFTALLGVGVAWCIRVGLF